MSPLAQPDAYQPPFPPFPPQPPYPPPPLPGTDPRLPAVHVTPPVVYVEATFEYRELSRDLAGGGAPLSEGELNELGREGWELVSVVNDGRTAHFYFKRPGR